MIRNLTVAVLAVSLALPAVSAAQGSPRRPSTRPRVRVEGITPGGPAEKAGLKAGDVITRFKGTALGGATSEDDERSGPGMKLIDLAHALDPGDTVQVEYRRGSDARKVTIVAEDMGGSAWTGPMEGPEMGAFKELTRMNM